MVLFQSRCKYHGGRPIIHVDNLGSAIQSIINRHTVTNEILLRLEFEGRTLISF